MRKLFIFLIVVMTFALFGCGGGGGGGSSAKADVALQLKFDTDIDVRASASGKDYSVGALYSDGELISTLTLRYGRSNDSMTSVDVLSSVISETPVTLTGLTVGATYIFSIEAANSGNTLLCSGTASAVIASVTNINLSCESAEADSYFKAYSPADSLSFVADLSDVLPDGRYVISGNTATDATAGFGIPFISVHSKTMSHSVSKYFVHNDPNYIMDSVQALTHDSSGNIYAVGARFSSSTVSGVPIIIKFDSDLNIIWIREVEYSGLGLPESVHIVKDAVSLSSGGIVVMLENAHGQAVLVKISADGDTIDYKSYQTQYGASIPVMPSAVLRDTASGMLIIVGTASDSGDTVINLMAVNPSNLSLVAYKEYFVANTASANAPVSYTAEKAAVDGSGNVYVFIKESGSDYYPGLMKAGFNGTTFSDSPSSIIYDNAANAVLKEHIALAVNDTSDTIMLTYTHPNDLSGANSDDYIFHAVNLDKDFSFNWMNKISDPAGVISLYGVGAYPLAGGAFAVLGEGENFLTYYGGTVLAKMDREGNAGNFGTLSSLWTTDNTTYIAQYAPYTVMVRPTAYTMSGSGGTVNAMYINSLTNGGTSSFDFTDTFMTTVATFISFLIDG